MGSMTLLGALLIHFLLPKSSKLLQKLMKINNHFIFESTEKIESVERTSVFSVLSNFSVTLNVLISVNCFLLIGFNEATLELHLKTV